MTRVRPFVLVAWVLTTATLPSVVGCGSKSELLVDELPRDLGTRDPVDARAPSPPPAPPDPIPPIEIPEGPSCELLARSSESVLEIGGAARPLPFAAAVINGGDPDLGCDYALAIVLLPERSYDPTRHPPPSPSVTVQVEGATGVQTVQVALDDRGTRQIGAGTLTLDTFDPPETPCAVNDCPTTPSVTGSLEASGEGWEVRGRFVASFCSVVLWCEF